MDVTDKNVLALNWTDKFLATILNKHVFEFDRTLQVALCNLLALYIARICLILRKYDPQIWFNVGGRKILNSCLLLPARHGFTTRFCPLKDIYIIF